MGANLDDPPPGFLLTAGEDGEWTVLYRQTGMGCVGLFFTAGSLLFTGVALSTIPDEVIWICLPMYVGQFVIVACVAWYFWSVTTFTFGPGALVVEWSLLWYRRQRMFSWQEVTVVKQVKDGREDDSFPIWGLDVVTETEVRVLSRVPIDKSDWLGPIIAKWAGVAFAPAKARRHETL